MQAGTRIWWRPSDRRGYWVEGAQRLVPGIFVRRTARFVIIDAELAVLDSEQYYAMVRGGIRRIRVDPARVTRRKD